MQTLDNQETLRKFTIEAVNVGFCHTGLGIKRFSTKKLMELLGAKLGQVHYRIFHAELLQRAYGCAFVNKGKQERIAAILAKDGQNSHTVKA